MSHPLVAPCQGIAELLIDVGTGVVENNRVDAEHAQALDGCGSLEQVAGHGHDVAREGGAVLEVALERVERHRAAEGLLGTGGLNQRHQLLGQCQGALGAVHQVDLYLVQVDASKQHLEVGVGVGLETERGNTLAQHLTSLGIGLGLVLDVDVLTHGPKVVGACATDKWILTGQRLGGLEVLDVNPAVERLHIEPFVCSPYHLLVKVGPLEVNLGLGAPLLGSYRRKHVEQSFSVFCHNVV